MLSASLLDLSPFSDIAVVTEESSSRLQEDIVGGMSRKPPTRRGCTFNKPGRFLFHLHLGEIPPTRYAPKFSHIRDET